MLFRKVIELRKSINKDRQEMYKLAKNVGLLDPSVIKISQKLDDEIVLLQKILSGIHPDKVERLHI